MRKMPVFNLSTKMENNIYLGYTWAELQSMKTFLEKQFADSTDEKIKRELFDKISQIKAAIRILTA